MSTDNQKREPEPRLTNAQKEAARRTGLSEREFAHYTEKAIQKGKVKREDIP